MACLPCGPYSYSLRGDTAYTRYRETPGAERGTRYAFSGEDSEHVRWGSGSRLQHCAREQAGNSACICTRRGTNAGRWLSTGIWHQPGREPIRCCSWPRMRPVGLPGGRCRSLAVPAVLRLRLQSTRALVPSGRPAAGGNFRAPPPVLMPRGSAPRSSRHVYRPAGRALRGR